MHREDGRSQTQHRKISLEIDKDVTYTAGLTKIMCTLNYSAQQKKGISATVIIEDGAVPRNISKTRVERLIEESERAIETIFDSLLLETENSYNIIFRVLCDNGSLLSAIINSASLTLLSYKVPIKYLVFSVTVGLSPMKHEEYIVDLTEPEERSDIPSITLATGCADYDTIISYGSTSKPIAEQAFLDLISYSVKASKEVSQEIIEKARAFGL
ncbi:hypothetical protein NEAUS03_1560 [Nematocida ausubeli]|nr:hypothetical protein NEAUS03_1560 [Nematocida ausubeli]